MVKRALAIIATILFLIGFTITLIWWQGERELRSEMQVWVEAGGALMPAEVAPPSVPDEENAGLMYQSTFAALDQLANAQNPIVSDPWSEDESVAASLKDHQELLDTIRRATLMQQCRWDINYNDATNMNVGRFSDIRQAAKLLASSAVYSARVGDDQSAVNDIEAMLQLSIHAAAGKRFLDHLVAAAVRRLALDAYEQLFEIRPAPQNDVSRLLERIDPHEDFASTVNVEAVGALCTFDSMASRRGFSPRDLRLRIMHARDQTYYISIVRKALEQSNLPHFERSLKSDRNPPFWAYVSTMIYTDFQAMSRSFAMTKSDILLCILAERLRAYKAEHGAYPDNLSAIDAPPIDPYTGKQFLYKRIDERFILRSDTPRTGDILRWEWRR